MSTADNRGLVADLLQQNLHFQKRWQMLSMLAYVVSTVGTLVFTTTASLLAAAGGAYAAYAAVLAAAATILVSLEKALLFREKWKFHLGMRATLEGLSAQWQLGQIDDAALSKGMTELATAYAKDLPIAPRDPP